MHSFVVIFLDQISLHISHGPPILSLSSIIMVSRAYHTTPLKRRPGASVVVVVVVVVVAGATVVCPVMVL